MATEKIGKNPPNPERHQGPKIEFKKLRNVKPELALKLAEALELYRIVLVSDKFKQAVLSHSYKGKKTFVDNRGWSNEKIYRYIMSKDHHLYVTAYWEDTNTIGWGSTKDDITRINTKYYNSYSPYEMAANLFHEKLHDMGFKHDVKYSYSRTKSVPYALGYMMKKLAREIHENAKAA